MGGVGGITGGDNSTCVVNSVAKLFCWGANTSGQVGDGTHESRLLPVAVAPQLDFIWARAGNHGCGITLANEGSIRRSASAGSMGKAPAPAGSLVVVEACHRLVCRALQ
jgi:regulator of chromosome condensation (RCC1) repeat-containing protein